MNIEDFDYRLELDFPPTVNNYYVKTRNGVFISAKGKKFRAHTADMVHAQLPDVHFDQKLHLTIVLHMPDRRTRDLDNYLKALLDALTKAGLWDDDSQVDQLEVYRGEIVTGGRVRMEICDAGPKIKLDQWPS